MKKKNTTKSKPQVTQKVRKIMTDRDINGLRFRARHMAEMNNKSITVCLEELAWQEGYRDWSSLIEANNALRETATELIPGTPMPKEEETPIPSAFLAQKNVDPKVNKTKVVVKKRRTFTRP